MFNRVQRRQLIRGTKRHGVGFTRQYSSARARRKHGTVCLGQVTDPESLNEHWQKLAGYTPVNVEPDTPAWTDAHDTFLPPEEEAVAHNWDNLVESLMAHNAKTIIEEIGTGEYDEFLNLVRQAEEDGKGRKTVLAAIDKRR